MTKLRMLWVVGALLAMAGCVTQKTYDESLAKNAALEQEYQELNRAMGAGSTARTWTITRMQDAIKVAGQQRGCCFPSGG